MKKKFNLTVIKPADVIGEESMSKVLGGKSDTGTDTGFCVLVCRRLVVCHTYTAPPPQPKPHPGPPPQPKPNCI